MLNGIDLVHDCLVHRLLGLGHRSILVIAVKFLIPSSAKIKSVESLGSVNLVVHTFVHQLLSLIDRLAAVCAGKTYGQACAKAYVWGYECRHVCVGICIGICIGIGIGVCIDEASA